MVLKTFTARFLNMKEDLENYQENFGSVSSMGLCEVVGTTFINGQTSLGPNPKSKSAYRSNSKNNLKPKSIRKISQV